MTPRRIAAAAAAALLSAGCGTAGTGTGVGSIEPRDGRSGLQLSGTIDGKQFAVNDGAPVMRLDDCDVNDGPDTDLCFFSRDLDGGYFALIIENPEAVKVGRVEVVASPCVSPNCEDPGAGAIAEVQFERGAPRVRAEGGSLTFRTVEPAQRYSGTMNLELPDGRITGDFEVVPRPEPEDPS